MLATLTFTLACVKYSKSDAIPMSLNCQAIGQAIGVQSFLLAHEMPNTPMLAMAHNSRTSVWLKLSRNDTLTVIWS